MSCTVILCGNHDEEIVDTLEGQLQSDDKIFKIALPKYPVREIDSKVHLIRTDYVVFVNPYVRVIYPNFLEIFKKHIEENIGVIFFRSDDIIDERGVTQAAYKYTKEDDCVGFRRSHYRSIRGLPAHATYYDIVKELCRMHSGKMFTPAIRLSDENYDSLIAMVRHDNERIRQEVIAARRQQKIFEDINSKAFKKEMYSAMQAFWMEETKRRQAEIQVARVKRQILRTEEEKKKKAREMATQRAAEHSLRRRESLYNGPDKRNPDGVKYDTSYSWMNWMEDKKDG